MRISRRRTVLVSALAAVLLLFFLEPRNANPKRQANLQHITAVAVSNAPAAAISTQSLGTGRPMRVVSNLSPEAALARRERLLSLAKSNPRQAFAESLSWAEWAALPAETRALVERPFSAMAEYVVHHACSPGATNRSLAVSRHLVLEGQTYQAQVFGGLARIGSKSQMPVRGFVLSNLAVLCDRSIEPLKSADLEAAQVMLSQAEFVPNHEEAQGPSESLLYGGRIYRLDRHQAGQLRALDATAAQSLHPRSYALALAAGLNSTGDRLNSPRALKAAALASADWSESPKTVLGIRVSFSSAPAGFSLSLGEANSALRGASNSISNFSYRKTWLVWTNTSIVLPETQEYYEQAGPLELRDAVRWELLAQGLDYAGFDIRLHFLPAMRGDRYSWAGLANGSDSFVNSLGVSGSQTTAVVIHELGHNYGIGHAHSWLSLTSSGSIPRAVPRDSEPGEHYEYGDETDVMGGDFSGTGHYGPRLKAALNWIEPANILDVKSDGIYRVFRFDHVDARNGDAKLALRVRSPSGDEYWIAHRKVSVPNLASIARAAYVVRSEGGSWNTALPNQTMVDTVPFSRTDGSLHWEARDAALGIGKTFRDPTGAFRLTTLAAGGTAAREYLDVQITFSQPSFGWFADAALATNGLVGSYFNGSFRGSEAPDWRGSLATELVATRVDESLSFPEQSFVRRPAGLTEGTDKDWEQFSVQWDGYVKVRRPTIVALASDDGSRMWIDRNGNGQFEESESEFLSNGWGFGGVFRSSPMPALQPGVYKVRVHYEEGSGGNFFILRAAEERFQVFADAALTMPGLTASFLPQSMRTRPNELDWRVTQNIAGSRVDPYPGFYTPTMGSLVDVGLVWGENGNNWNWDNFAVQWDGFLSNSVPMRLATISLGGSRLMIDLDRDGMFAQRAPELLNNNWRISNPWPPFGPRSTIIPPGAYPIRIQYNEDLGQGLFVLGAETDLAHASLVTFPPETFDGTNFLESARPVAGDFTIQFWIRTSDLSGGAADWRNGAVLMDASVGPGAGDFGITMAAGALLFGAGDSVTLRSGPIADGHWHFVSASREQSTGLLTLMVDGIQAARAIGPMILLDASPSIYFGARPDGTRGFRGTLGPGRIWSVVRSTDQVLADLHLSREDRWPDPPNLRISATRGERLTVEWDPLSAFRVLESSARAEGPFARVFTDQNRIDFPFSQDSKAQFFRVTR